MKIKRDAKVVNDKLLVDERLAFYQICMETIVLCFPYFNRIVNYSFVLKNISLSNGVC